MNGFSDYIGSSGCFPRFLFISLNTEVILFAFSYLVLIVLLHMNKFRYFR